MTVDAQGTIIYVFDHFPDEIALSASVRLQAHCRNGGAVIVVLHDLMLANHYCQRLQLLYQGSTLAEGPPGDVLTPDHLKQAYGLQVSDEAKIDRCFQLPWKIK